MIDTSGQLCRSGSVPAPPPAAPSILEGRNRAHNRCFPDVERKITVVAVVAVERSGLPAGHESGRRSHPRAPSRGPPRMHPPSSRRSGPGPSRSIDLGSGQLQPVQRIARQRFPRSPACRACLPQRIGLIHRHRQHRIGAQLIMIVQILVPQTESVDALPCNNSSTVCSINRGSR